MDLWVIFIVLAVIFAVGEIATTSFFLGPFAISALLAAIADAAGAPIVASWAIFVAGGALLLTFVRPVAKRHLYTPPQIRTGTAALQGQGGIVLERIVNDEGVGTVRINGEVWTARSYDERPIEAGEKVQVVEIRGATALVSET
ncbi:MAG: NfeD family protein [Solirubrobacteraceae bacterium]|nr:NfeD family protein [Solirubrobacteraceae bacterium]